MKKTLLLSVVASTMIMAGGDIAPVEPVVQVATPAPAAVSGWNFTGQAVLFYQTQDNNDYAIKSGTGASTGSLFSQDYANANAGIGLKAENTDLIGGLGAGVKLIGLGTLGLEKDVVSNVMERADGTLNGGAITELYLTYGIGNTTAKVGRQTLPMSLSPLAFSEGWNVFENTFEAALLVNSDLPDTTLVGAYVKGANKYGNMGSFRDMTTAGGAAVASDGAYMITAQNKSIEDLTLTGSFYYVPEMIGSDDVMALWGDIAYSTAIASTPVNFGLQGGALMLDTAGLKDTNAFGAKVGAKLGMFDTMLAYASVNDGTAPLENLGTNVKTPLYVQMIGNQQYIKKDADTAMLRIGTEALGGKIGLDVSYTDRGAANLTGAGDFVDAELIYTTKVGPVNMFAAYIYMDDDNLDDTNNAIRVWARYNF